MLESLTNQKNMSPTRRSFLLGMLATGIGFYTVKTSAHEFIPCTVPKQLGRMYELPDRQLRAYRLFLYDVNDESWTTPKLESVERKEMSLVFKCASLDIVEESQWKGCFLVDDGGYKFRPRDFGGILHCQAKDKIILTYTVYYSLS